MHTIKRVKKSTSCPKKSCESEDHSMNWCEQTERKSQRAIGFPFLIRKAIIYLFILLQLLKFVCLKYDPIQRGKRPSENCTLRLTHKEDEAESSGGETTPKSFGKLFSKGEQRAIWVSRVKNGAAIDDLMRIKDLDEDALDKEYNKTDTMDLSTEYSSNSEGDEDVGSDTETQDPENEDQFAGLEEARLLLNDNQACSEYESG